MSNDFKQWFDETKSIVGWIEEVMNHDFAKSSRLEKLNIFGRYMVEAFENVPLLEMQKRSK